VTQRNLDRAFLPKSIAVIGASPREGSVGRVVLDNIRTGSFAGAVYPVNLKYDEVLGSRCYRRVADLPEAPDLAVIMTPPATVPQLVSEIGARGGKAVVILTAGIGSADGLRQQMLDAAKPHLLRIIGPNTIGLLAPGIGLNASFAHIPALAGRLGLISQSGAIVSSLIDWSVAEGIGFSQIVSLGDMTDVDVGDCLNMLATDAGTSAIVMYLESIPHPRKFMSAARAASRIKPVIVVKPGRHPAAAKAAQTHTGALAGADRVIDAALRRAGIIRVDGLDQLLEAAEVTARFAPLRRARVAIVTNGGGAGVLAVDQLLDHGCEMAELTSETLAKLDAALPVTWSHGNPIDIIGDAPPDRYREAITAVAADAGVDVILAMQCPTALAAPGAAAEAVATLVKRGMINGKPLLACWLGRYAAGPAREILQRAGIASFDTPTQIAFAVSLLTRWSHLRASLARVPPSHPIRAVDQSGAAAVLRRVAGAGRALLTEPEAKLVLAAYSIPVPPTVVVATEEEVQDAARQMLKSSEGIVVKLLSRAISHKSDIGGVALDLRTSEDAHAAAVAIRQRVRDHDPSAVLDGFTVQPMIRRPGAHELIAGLHLDPSFGPTLLFGAGGTSVEVVDDIATEIVPIDDVLAGDMVDRTRVARLLAGYRDRPPADRSAILATLTALSQLAIDFPAIIGVDINPLLADTDGVIALDARIEIDPALIDLRSPNPRLAISPYPSGRETMVELGELRLTLRPIRPDDAVLYPAFLERMDPEDMRLRFLMPMTTVSPDLLVRLTRLDYDREMAFVAIAGESGALCGIVRYSADPDRERAEFGVLVRSDLRGIGLGTALMRTLMDYARSEGIRRLEGMVLHENTRMLQLCDELGFTAQHDANDLMLVRVALDLAGRKF
jgi:acetyltransferase